MSVPGLSQHPLPPSCVTQSAFGVKCPGCGLTRSFIHLAHGRWTAAWSVHRLGWLVFGAALLQVPYRLSCIYRDEPPFAGSRVPTWFSWLIIALLIGNWAVQMVA